MGVIFVIFFAAVFPCVAAESSAQTISAEMWQHSSIEEEQKGGVHYSSSKEFDGEEDTVILDVAAGSPVVFYQYFLDLPRPEVNTLYTFSVRIKTEFVSDGVGAFASLGMRTEPDGPRVIASDTERVTGTKDWQQVSAALFIPEQCAGLQLLLLLHGTGKAWFAVPTLTPVEKFVDASESEVSIAVHDSPVIENFIGFGLEDDCYFFTDENFRHGINAADIHLRESRIEELDPKVIATLFWWDAICPSHDLDKITYETELMRALYTTLEPHQQSRRSVLFSDSHWGWTTEQFPYSEKNFEKGVDVYVRLFEHLIHEKGFDCIRYVSISGEVDMVFEQLGGTFKSYVQSVNLFRKKLDAAGLEQVQIIGDKTGGLLWFRNAVAAVGETMDLFAVHEYPDVTQYAVLPYRLGSALEAVRTYAPKPDGITDSRWPQAFVWEIGYHNQTAGDTDNKATAVHDFSYGLLCAYTCITAMNQGYSGGSVWCLHSMYYPGQNRMDFGFWGFKDKEWRIRPFYYAYGLFTRFLEAGMTPLQIDVTPTCHDAVFSVLKSEDQRKWRVCALNLSEEKIKITISGLPDLNFEVYAYTADQIPEQGDLFYGKMQAMLKKELWNSSVGILDMPSESLMVLTADAAVCALETTGE